MQSISVFLDTTKVADFRWKNVDISRVQGVYHMIYLFFGSSLGVTVPSLFIVGYVADVTEGSASKKPILNRIKRDRQTDRLTHKHTYTHTHTHTHTHTQRDRQTDRQKDRQTEKHTDRETETETDRQTERQTETDREREREKVT